jgi:2-oxoglutarate dehydrogenase complex dehydrogenase (E1) component-like enzyme
VWAVSRWTTPRCAGCCSAAARSATSCSPSGSTADTAVLRVEQLYPLPAEEIVEALERYPNAGDVVWVQEEPANMGAAQFMAVNLPEHLPAGRTLRRISRKASASPAVGSAKVHEVEQRQLVAQAFAD